MIKKQLIIVLLFVVIAGAIAGAFVFLNHLRNNPALPEAADAGQTGLAPNPLHAESTAIIVQEPESMARMLWNTKWRGERISIIY